MVDGMKDGEEKEKETADIGEQREVRLLQHHVLESYRSQGMAKP